MAFNYFTKIGPKTMQKLLKTFPEARTAFSAPAARLEKSGLSANIVTDFCAWREKIDFSKLEDELAREKISFITWDEPEYPALLKEIATPPYVLYYRGSLESIGGLDKNRLSVVGARDHSAYAPKVIAEFLPPLIKEKIQIISGLALGIDALAHSCCLLNRGITIAVLGTGLDDKSIYPGVNKNLAHEIINSGGALISEFPPGTAPLRQNFPQRNRIISGLSQATLIIEAKLKSGALITADYALDQNREVMAVPGNIYSALSQGTNKLIQAGAKCINCPQDILEIFRIDHASQFKIKKKPAPVYFQNKTEELIYRLIREAHERCELITGDEIAQITKLDTSVINSTLSMLELRGFAKNDGIGYDIN